MIKLDFHFYIIFLQTVYESLQVSEKPVKIFAIGPRFHYETCPVTADKKLWRLKAFC